MAFATEYRIIVVLIEFECHWSQNGKAIRENIVESEMRYASKGVGDEAADQEGHNDQEYAKQRFGGWPTDGDFARN